MRLTPDEPGAPARLALAASLNRLGTREQSSLAGTEEARFDQRIRIEHRHRIPFEATRVLVPGGHLVLEVADGHAGEALRLLRERGYDDVRAGRDLTGRDRVAEGRWSSAP